MSKPVGTAQVVPTTLFKERRVSGGEGRPRPGDLGGRGKKGELEGVNRSRFVGVEDIFSPWKNQAML